MRKDKLNIVHILLGFYDVDSRVRNETESLANQYAVWVFCFGRGLRVHRFERRGVTIIEFPKPGNVISFLFMLARMGKESWLIRPTVVHCHDAVSLPVGYFLKTLTQAKFIYDSHELWSQAHHRPRPLFVLKMSLFIERFLARRADQIITVSNGIALYLMGYFCNRNVAVVRNTPSYVQQSVRVRDQREVLRSSLGIGASDKVLVYQGLVKRERGVFLLLDAMRTVNDPSIKLMIVGDGPDFNELVSLTKSLKLQRLIKFAGKVVQDDLAKYTMSGDVGIHAIPNTCLNHDLCLPNKLFEYLNAGLPVLVTNLREMSSFVISNNLGLTFEDSEPSSIASAIESIFANARYLELAKTVAMRRELFDWSLDSSVLSKIYEDVLK